MAKYHINKNGVPSACRARTRPCPLGGDDIHFNSKEEAQAYSDKLAKQEFGILPTELPTSEKERLLYHSPFIITRKMKTSVDIAMDNIEKYPVGTWLAFETKSGFSSTTTRFVKVGKGEWVNQLTLKGQLDEKPLSDNGMKALINENKKEMSAIGTLDSNRKYFAYSIEYYDDEDDICEINSSEIDSLHEAKELLKKEMKGLRVKEWWIHNQDGKCIEHW